MGLMKGHEEIWVLMGIFILLDHIDGFVGIYIYLNLPSYVP